MNSHELISSVKDHTLILTINRPDRRNAMSAEVLQKMKDELTRANSDDDIRAIVITGTGSDAFCSGADLGSGKSFSFDYSEPQTAYANLLRAARNCQKPLIAKVNGACMAGGIGLMAMCDLAVSTRKAIFGLPEVKVGVFPMQVLSVLQGAIPDRWLAQLCLTGDPIDAQTALQIGLINKISDDLEICMDELLSRLVSVSPTAVRRGLYAIKRNRGLAFEQSISFTEGQIGLLAMTEDAKEGQLAFREKRKANWTGQ